MMNEALPETRYRKQLDAFHTLLDGLEQKRKRIAWARFATFVATIIVAYKIFSVYGIPGLLPTVVGIGVLLYLVSRDVLNNEEIRNTKTLIRLNEEEIRVLKHQYTDREKGDQFLPAEHAYANDLDIFGEATIYQWLSRCYTEQGRQLLASNLLHPLPLSSILKRQDAVKELAQKLDWRQHWQAFAMQKTITAATQRKIEYWLEGDEKHFLHPAWKIIVSVYSILTLASAVAAITGFIPGALFSTLFLLYLILSVLLSRNTILPYIQLNGIVKEAATLQSLIDWLESADFSSAYLKDLQTGIKGASSSAGSEIKELKKILDRFDLRASVVGFLFFNPFLLWDVRQIISLNNWRRRNKAVAKKWFEALAEMEVLHSISTLHFNQPGWCFPTFTECHFTLEGENIGHPLLPERQRVSNDFTLKGTAQIGLVTGSNMAGKSTFLRSLGVNMVLAQIGAPVCASRMLLSPVQLVSSMRIADNLAENTSTFYAELKKLRTIIEMVKAHQQVFI
ncbi:MAG TPA: hypothetical protein VFT06_12500, partial [Flavisolibacter sp.]|nr:hypothetical protein [Flavisolibacter sp.]